MPPPSCLPGLPLADSQRKTEACFQKPQKPLPASPPPTAVLEIISSLRHSLPPLTHGMIVPAKHQDALVKKGGCEQAPGAPLKVEGTVSCRVKEEKHCLQTAWNFIYTHGKEHISPSGYMQCVRLELAQSFKPQISFSVIGSLKVYIL